MFTQTTKIILFIHFPDHHPQALFHFLGPFPRTTCKITYTLLRLLSTPTYLAKHQNNYLPWQLLLFCLRHASFHHGMPSSLLNRCTVSLEFSPPSAPLLPFLSHHLLHGFFHFMSSTSAEFMPCLWELQEERSVSFRQKVLLEDRETVSIENPLIWW